MFISSKSLPQKEQSRDSVLKTKEIEYNVENRPDSQTQIAEDDFVFEDDIDTKSRIKDESEKKSSTQDFKKMKFTRRADL